MPTYAVIARSDKELGGGLAELRDVLRAREIAPSMWRELPEGGDVADAVSDVVGSGADLLFVWGGDGTIQRCVHAVAGSDVAIAILPAGGGNLLAHDLGIPLDVGRAVDVALTGGRRRIDTMVANGEHFAMVAGAGLSAVVMQDHHRKSVRERAQRVMRLGRGAMALRRRPISGEVTVDGRLLHRGELTCILVTNIAEAVANVDDFEAPQDDDGLLEVGVVSPAPSASG